MPWSRTSTPSNWKWIIGASRSMPLIMQAALATVVGVLIEVPVMLSVVKIVNASKGWYEKGLKANA